MARVQGDPTKPRTAGGGDPALADPPVSALRARSDSPTKAIFETSIGLSRARSSRVLKVFSMSGPLLSSISKSTPIPGRGVRMSEKRMTPSGLKDFHGWSEISTMRSVVSERSRKEGCLEARSR